MMPLFRYAPSATLAALLVTGIEALRLVLLDTVVLGSFGHFTSIFFAIAGLVGLPLCVIGACGLVLFPMLRWLLRRSWGSALGSEDAESVPGSMRLAWSVYALCSTLVLMLGAHMAVMKFWGRWQNEAFLGLGVALVIGIIAPCLMLCSRPIATALARLFRRMEPVGRPWLNPTTLRGAWVWFGGLTFGLLWIASTLYHPLHNLDLRPLYLMGGWLYSLPFFVRFASTLSHRLSLGIALTSTVFFTSAFFWSAASLGESQSRILTIDQRTVLAGVVLRRLENLGDGDGDGVSRWFAGGDCDDGDHNIRPGVYDAPDDGIDQNCTGSDLRLGEPVLPTPQRDPVGERKDWNVILLTIDTLRGDVVEQEMPRLTALAAQGQVFSRAYSHGAATYWTMASLQTSKMPSRLHLDRTQTPVGSETLLGEVLRNNGWHTGLFANVTVFFVRGLNQGMYVRDYKTSDHTVHGAKPGSEFLTDSLLAHIDRWSSKALKVKRDKFYIWGHYYDPHDPYFEVPGFPSEDSSDEARYRAICRYVDHHIGRLVDGLKERGLWDKTLLVITSDHGEEFGDHGHRFHGQTLYEEMTNIPMILHVPGQAPKEIVNPVGQMEIAPTILDLLGVPIPDVFEGRSRKVEVLNEGTLEEEPVFLEVFPDSNYKSHQVGMVLGSLKLIYRLSDNYFELYDLATDPKERENIVDDHPDAGPLKAILGRYVDHHLYALAQGKTGAELPPGSPPVKVKKTKKQAKKKRSKKPRKKRKRSQKKTKKADSKRQRSPVITLPRQEDARARENRPARPSPSGSTLPKSATDAQPIHKKAAKGETRSSPVKP